MENPGKILICATPIGNLDDISKRFKDSLQLADVVYCEDTRITAKLLNFLNVKKPVKRLDENVMDKLVKSVVDQAKAGSVVAYCSDAGMPGVSDPGLKLVSTARKNGVNVQVISGPSAAINAYVASGFNNQNFYFGGFLPRKNKEKIQYLQSLRMLNAVLIFYESPKRLINSLKNIVDVMPDANIAICRELTKLHEEVFVDSSQNVYEEFSSREHIKGEIVICIENKVIAEAKPNIDDDSIIKTAKKLNDAGLKSSQICDILQTAYNLSKKKAYEISLNAKK